MCDLGRFTALLVATCFGGVVDSLKGLALSTLASLCTMVLSSGLQCHCHAVPLTPEAASNLFKALALSKPLSLTIHQEALRCSRSMTIPGFEICISCSSSPLLIGGSPQPIVSLSRFEHSDRHPALSGQDQLGVGVVVAGFPENVIRPLQSASHMREGRG